MSKEIQLTQGKVAIVDDENYDWLNQWKWQATKSRNTYYAVRQVYLGGGRKNSKYVHLKMHRVILGLIEGDGKITDHRDDNGLNNKIANLRICNFSQNLRNQKPRKNCSSQYKGVYWRKNRQRWIVEIKINGKLKRFGSFKNEIEAARCYDQKAKELFGEFARTNF